MFSEEASYICGGGLWAGVIDQQPDLSSNRDSSGEAGSSSFAKPCEASCEPAEDKLREALQPHQGSHLAADLEPPEPTHDAAGEPQSSNLPGSPHLHPSSTKGSFSEGSCKQEDSPDL